MKRKAGLLLILIVVLAFSVGCGSKEPEDVYVPTTNTEGAEMVVTIEDGNVVASGESDYFSSKITYVFSEEGYQYTFSKTEYKQEGFAEQAYESAVNSGFLEVTIDGDTVSFKADDTYMFTGMSVESAAHYIAQSVIF